MRWLVIFALGLLAVPLAAQGTIVIVSDSDCDVAMAELLASVMEAEVVKVEWGFFDEEAIAEVVESEPDNIIIIGGTKAVVDQIQEVRADGIFHLSCSRKRQGRNLFTDVQNVQGLLQ